MSSKIHPSAIIEDGAVIGNNIEIGPYCVIGAQVTIGDSVRLHSHVVMDGITTIGEGTEIFPFASIGKQCQDLKYKGEPTTLEIGKNNTIREHVTMNPGTVQGGGKTVVGNNCLFMIASHVAHDCIIGNNVIMANNATLGGHVEVDDYAIIGGLAAVHQFVRIGSHAVIGGMSGVESDVIPYGRVKGDRAYLAGLNLIGLERRGFSKDQIKTLQKAFNSLFSKQGTMDERIRQVSEEYASESYVMDVIEFAKGKTRFPLCQPQRKIA